MVPQLGSGTVRMGMKDSVPLPHKYQMPDFLMPWAMVVRLLQPKHRNCVTGARHIGDLCMCVFI